MANQHRGLGCTGGAKTEKGLAQHLHTARSPSDRAGAGPVLMGVTGAGGWTQLHTQYRQSIRCIFIRQYKSLCINKAKHQG